jgi:hypothetical protein
MGTNIVNFTGFVKCFWGIVKLFLAGWRLSRWRILQHHVAVVGADLRVCPVLPRRLPCSPRRLPVCGDVCPKPCRRTTVPYSQHNVGALPATPCRNETPHIGRMSPHIGQPSLHRGKYQRQKGQTRRSAPTHVGMTTDHRGDRHRRFVTTPSPSHPQSGQNNPGCTSLPKPGRAT